MFRPARDGSALRAALAGRGPRVAAGALLLLVVAGGTLAARLPRVRAGLLPWLATAGALPADHWLAFSVGQVLVAACGILPASLMAVAAGAAYGMVNGLLLSAACTMLGGWIAFLLSRSMLRPVIARWIGRHGASARFDAAIGQDGWRFVCLLRISPVMPFAATSYGLGLTRIGQRAYLAGTAASLPALAFYVALGAFGGRSVMLARAGQWRWLLPLLGLAAIALAVARVRRIVARAARAPV